MQAKLISIVAPCFNEQENIVELHKRLSDVFARLPAYAFEVIFIDNCSTDNTAALIKSIIEQDRRIKLIVNARNFGHIRSPYYGMIQAQGDAVILMATDLQDPPELIADFIAKWEAGSQVVAAVKDKVDESWLFGTMRKCYYRLLTRISEAPVIEHFTGFGLYDKSVVRILRECYEPYPYLRGMIADMGFSIATVQFHKPTRKRGISKNNLYTLYDMAMLGITNHSRVPLRMAIFIGITCAALSLLGSMYYLVMKLLYWDFFSIGQAPTVIGLAMLGSFQLCFIGLLGEYILAMNTRVQKRPLVVERERVNFD